jgi:pantoate--beta-alanine ligase
VKIARTISEVRRELEPLRDGSIGLVPTMGALHEGHLSLCYAARAECDTVVLSIFVNPAQFGDGTDLASYPRDEERDLEFLRRHAEEDQGVVDVDIVFVPSLEEMYPQGFQTWVDVTELGAGLEGTFRPGHFRGVATVVLKLFEIVRPSKAFFGRKDAQQSEVVRQMVRDLALDLEILVVPTVRDADGLAVSSRNARLSPEERIQAASIFRALQTRDPTRARAVLAEAGLEPDYLEVMEADGHKVLATAVRVGSTRLIDNVVLEGDTQ